LTSPKLREQVEKAAETRAVVARIDPPPALLVLAQQLGLSLFERDILLLCTGMELDTRIAALCARAQGEPMRPYPTYALALALLDAPSWDALSPYSPLRHFRLLELAQPAGTPLTFAALRADERIVNYIKGLNAIDDRLSSVFTLARAMPELSLSQLSRVDEVMWHLSRAAAVGGPLVVQLLGSDVQSKQLVACQVAGSSQRDLFVLSLAELMAHGPDVDLVARLWQRESMLIPLALLVDAQTEDSPEALRTLYHFLSRTFEARGIVLLAVRDALPQLAATSATVEVSKPQFEEQRAAWLQVLADQPAANQLASQFSLNLPVIQAFAGQAEGLTLERVWALCCLKTRPRLDTLAQRLNPKATWDDLVLPSEPLRLLHAIADQVRNRATVYHDWGFERKMNRGLGISALFAGESGTGKTMAAEVIANELELNLYRIDLSAVVSKYIGETEKNLRQLFDAAEDGGDILFFDEADALFGRRSEVKDSHDRYANIEINYLLQRMETYGGLAILATNMKTAIDPAFIRRLRFVVNLAFPSVAERKAMWQKVFPPQTPHEQLDLDRLARFALTGANIRSVAINAAFLAAESKSPVTMPHVLTATEMELRKQEKPINKAEFKT
jgi:hypothetical protein